MSKKLFAFTLLLLSIVLTSNVFAQEATDEAEDYATYLESHYGITFDGDVTQDAFRESLTQIFGEVELPAEIDAEGFSLLEAATTALYQANLDEVANVLPEERVTAALADVADASSLDLAQQRYLAAALNLGLIDATADFAQPVTSESGINLLGRTTDITGHYQNFLGYVSDPEIYSRLVQVWESFDQVSAPELQAAAVELIREGVISGYNLKRLSSDPGFDPELTINYGHATISHALQLVALLNGLGVDAKVQLEPKTSAYLSLAEWGGTPPSEPELQSDVLEDGNWITYAKEYDLLFEFFTVEDRDQFDTIIRTYAQRTDTSEPRLASSFWVPLYSSRVDLGEEYTPVFNHVAYENQFYIQSFSLVENVDSVKERYEAAFPNARHEIWEDLWVNKSFYDYLVEATAEEA